MKSGRGSLSIAAHPLDTICLLKRWASDTELCQAPVLVLPYGRATQCLPGSLPSGLQQHNPPKFAAEWLQLAAYLVKHMGTQSAAKTARYLVALATGRIATGTPCPLPVHEKGRPELLVALNAAMTAPAGLRALVPAAVFRAVIRR